MPGATHLINDFCSIGGHRIAAPCHVPVGTNQNQGALVYLPHLKLIQRNDIERQASLSCRVGEGGGIAFPLQLELVGLSRLGSNPLRVLKDNVPGYQLLREERTSNSPFTPYD